MLNSPFIYFTDAVLRAPTIGCMLMCFASALVGVIVFLRKQSLLGESLSHAAYPGAILGVIFAGIFDVHEDLTITLLIMCGAIFSAICGFFSISFLEKQLNVRTDSALCFVLSVFFGIGITLASQVQFAYSSLYRQVQIYLYGQAATMTDIHIAIYGCLSALVLVTILLFYKEIYIITFDQTYARSLGINIRLVNTLIFLLIIVAVVIGIRSVGVVLMSAMLIAPSAAARQFTNKLYLMLILAAFFGMLSGFLGNYLSVEMTQLLKNNFPNSRLTLPTGPMIVIVASSICLLSLMLAPKRGFLLRLFRIGRFRFRCMSENLLKAMWRLNLETAVQDDKVMQDFELESLPVGGDHSQKVKVPPTGSDYGSKSCITLSSSTAVSRLNANDDISFNEIAKHQSSSRIYLKVVLNSLIRKRWVERTKKGYRLTNDGVKWAAHIIRLHRLWEIYLVDYLGVRIDRTHCSAEEMEHIITPELEKDLILLLKDSLHQPIPYEGV